MVMTKYNVIVLFVILSGFACSLYWGRVEPLMGVLLFFGFPPGMHLLPGVWRRKSPPPPPAHEDLKRRIPVWRALAQYYLNDTQDEALLLRALTSSGYNLRELEEILYREVHPTFFLVDLDSHPPPSALEISEDSLRTRVLTRLENEPSNFALVPGRWLYAYVWTEILELLAQAPLGPFDHSSGS